MKLDKCASCIPIQTDYIDFTELIITCLKSRSNNLYNLYIHLLLQSRSKTKKHHMKRFIQEMVYLFLTKVNTKTAWNNKFTYIRNKIVSSFECFYSMFRWQHKQLLYIIGSLSSHSRTHRLMYEEKELKREGEWTSEKIYNQNYQVTYIFIKKSSLFIAWWRKEQMK